MNNNHVQGKVTSFPSFPPFPSFCFFFFIFSLSLTVLGQVEN